VARLDFRHRPDTDFKEIGDLSADEARREVEALRDGIEYHDHCYYVKNEPRISDTVYDKLFRRLEALEEAFPDLASDNSPTRRVGAEPLDELRRVEHTAPLLSLQAVFDAADVRAFLDTLRQAADGNRPVVIAEPKFDGVSVEVVYELSVEDLGELEGFAEKKAHKLHEAIQGARRPRLDRFLFALGIRHVGRRIARVLADQFRSLARLREADERRLQEIPEIGPEIAGSVARFFAETRTAEVLEHFARAGLEVQDMPAAGDGQARPLTGKTFVFTGNLRHFTRDEAQDRVERLGGRATSSVSGQTDYLVVGENPGSKLDQADKHGVKVLVDKGFERLIAKQAE
jgi:NAD-dependent DNA ligase